MNQQNNLLVATPIQSNDLTALQAQIATLQAQVSSLCINDNTGVLRQDFTFNKGDKWRVYFINSIMATTYVDLISFTNQNGDFIQIIHRGLSVKLLKYVTGVSSLITAISTGLSVDITDNFYGYWNNSVSQAGGSNNLDLIANAHLVKVVKIS